MSPLIQTPACKAMLLKRVGEKGNNKMSTCCACDVSGNGERGEMRGREGEREREREREREMEDVEQSEAHLAALKYISSWSSVVWSGFQT